MDSHKAPPRVTREYSDVKIDATGPDGAKHKVSYEKMAWLGESGFVHFVGEDEKPNVLLVEDDGVQAAVLSKWLKEENKYHVVVAKDGAQAYSLVADSAPGAWDLILSDKNLPRMSGIELLEKVFDSGRCIPFLIMSAESDISQSEQALARGSHDYLIKPLNKAQLLLRVSQTLELHKNAARNAAYRQFMTENISQMKKLQEVAAKKDEEVEATIAKIEAPIGGITATLAQLLADPQTAQNPPLKAALEGILKKLVGDLYAPSLDRLQASLDPIALSLVQSYAHSSDSAVESGGSSAGSRKASLAVSEQMLPKEMIELYGLSKWEFSCWDFPEDDLVLMLHAMIMVWSTPDFELDPLKLQKFIESVRAGYKKNPYHSFVHAFDVTQTCFVLLTTYGAAEKWGLTTLETLSVLVAALCHDIGHPGVNNRFLVLTHDELALTYNDKSVLENHHCAETFRLLRNPLTSFFPPLPESTYREMRNIIISCILATDMAVHFEKMAKLEQKVSSGGALENLPDADRLFLMEHLVHTADLSNVAKPWTAAYRWSQAVSAEFFAQGDRETAAGLVCEAFMDRARSSVEKNSANFIKYVVQKYYGVMAQVIPNAGKMLIANLTDNLQRLERLSQ